MTIVFIALILPHLLPCGTHIRPPLLVPMLPIRSSRLLLESAKPQPGPLQGPTVAFNARILPHPPYGSLVRPPPPFLIPMLSFRHSRPLPESSGLRPGPRQWTTMTTMTTIWGRVHIPTYAHLLRSTTRLQMPKTGKRLWNYEIKRN